MADRIRELSERALAALEDLLREVLERRTSGAALERELVGSELSLRVPGPGRRAAEAEQLAAQAERLVDDAVFHATAFRPGSVFCLRCGAPDCEHGSPSGSREVFAGYTPTGLPRWSDFAQRCLDLRVPEAERLYEPRPALLTLVHDGQALRRGLVEAFDLRRHKILGQVAAGFFPVPTREDEGRGVVAVTFQIVVTRREGGRSRYGLNILGRDPSGEHLAALWERQPDVPWRTAVRWARIALSSLEGKRTRAEERRRVEGILGGLARRLERDSRARARRTAHAEQRHASGERPTPKAVDDVAAAGPDRVLIDQRTGSRVVLGDRGRTHFFTEDGRLVSSVRYRRDAIERKRKNGDWREATREEHEALIERVPHAAHAARIRMR